jgi:hypothetical protein
MEVENIKPYTGTCVQICMTCCTNPQKFDRQIRYHALNAVASVITASEDLILPFMNEMLEVFHKIIKDNANNSEEQEIRGQALMCTGNLAAVSGKEKFPAEALTEFTKFGMECLEEKDSKF